MKIFGSGILDLVPGEFRRRGMAVVAGAVAGALLDFVSLAALVPVLMLVTDAQRLHSCAPVERIYVALGFDSERNFTLAVCCAVIAVILIKSLLKIAIARGRSSYFLSLYRYFSCRLLHGYHQCGYLFVRRNNSARLAHDINSVCMAFCAGVLGSLVDIVGELLLAAMIFAALVVYSPVTAIVVIAVFVPVVSVYGVAVRGRLQQYGKEENEARWRQQRIVTESFRGYAEIEINDAFPSVESRFHEGLDNITRLRRRMEIIMQIPSVLIEVCVAVAMVSLVALRADIVVMGVFAVSALRLLPAVRAILACRMRIRNNLYTVEIVARGTESCGRADDVRMDFGRQIDIRNVEFRFEEDEEPVIEGLDLTVGKGERIGIQGASGGGKTTLLNLLLGLYAPTAGGIFVDGVELTERNRRSWQNIVGYVPQEVFLMDATIAENVSLGREFDRERVMRALRTASLAEFVESLPHGIDTPVRECGNRLSGGQRQRIGIARALYREAEVLFFDEATSSLDDRTEREITEAIASLSRNRRELTIVIVAHRTSSLDFCDRVVRMEDMIRRV